MLPLELEGQEGIALGIRSFPVRSWHSFVLTQTRVRLKNLQRKSKMYLDFPITVNLVTKENVIRDTMERVNEILNIEGETFNKF